VVGLINVFSTVPLGSMLLGLLIPLGLFYLMAFPANLLLWWGGGS